MEREKGEGLTRVWPPIAISIVIVIAVRRIMFSMNSLTDGRTDRRSASPALAAVNGRLSWHRTDRAAMPMRTRCPTGNLQVRRCVGVRLHHRARTARTGRDDAVRALSRRLPFVRQEAARASHTIALAHRAPTPFIESAPHPCFLQTLHRWPELHPSLRAFRLRPSGLGG